MQDIQGRHHPREHGNQLGERGIGNHVGCQADHQPGQDQVYRDVGDGVRPAYLFSDGDGNPQPCDPGDRGDQRYQPVDYPGAVLLQPIEMFDVNSIQPAGEPSADRTTKQPGDPRGQHQRRNLDDICPPQVHRRTAIG